MENISVNREYKSSLFVKIFGSEKHKRNALDLYNALANTNYTNLDDLTFTTLDDAVYISVKNDVSFLIGNNMTLFEHQSTFNPNMPLRGFIYYAHLYQAFIEKCGTSIYGTKLLKIPTPKYIVFYNGTDREMKDEEVLRLSDSFMTEDKTNDFEWTARVLNVNIGHNEKLFDKCRILWEFSMFIDTARKCINEVGSVNDGVVKAVDECIKQDILKDYLLDNKSEVVAMCIVEFDQVKYEQTLIGEGIQIGLEQGLEQGASAERRQIVERMLSNGFSKKQIIDITGYSEEDIDIVIQ